MQTVPAVLPQAQGAAPVHVRAICTPALTDPLTTGTRMLAGFGSAIGMCRSPMNNEPVGLWHDAQLASSWVTPVPAAWKQVYGLPVAGSIETGSVQNWFTVGMVTTPAPAPAKFT